MANVFGGGGRRLHLSNGGTEVFLDVLLLAVSELAERPWEHRFAALLTWHDQNAVGRGAVGFDLAEIDWGPSPQERAAAKGFVLRVLDLALRRHRWDELGYEPPFAADQLREYRAIVEAFEPVGTAPGHSFPGPDEAADVCCVRHRVLFSQGSGTGCVFCGGEASAHPAE
ncbi:hypothetical protein [Streptomyces sp. RKAG290]|uniref:hypothetical protein n=1 Tax=Streptomyces sp. RKAG290 TaxID=2888348 RepID=UPI0020336CD4|nr:hypothetical protein [Streptomyces sp. RKAG290]MCM2415163.1 hypothetical protein [Streptomyces sp. RKAG290]